jgi:hypothetical protein
LVWKSSSANSFRLKYKEYEAALKTDQFLLIAHGTAAEVAKAKNIIEPTNPAILALLRRSSSSGNNLAPCDVLG